MVLKLYSMSRAGGGNGVVALVLAEKQIPFEHIPIEMGTNDNKTPKFIAMNPWGQVPVIVSPPVIAYICRRSAHHVPGRRRRHRLRKPRDLPVPRREIRAPGHAAPPHHAGGQGGVRAGRVHRDGKLRPDDHETNQGDNGQNVSDFYLHRAPTPEY